MNFIWVFVKGQPDLMQRCFHHYLVMVSNIKLLTLAGGEIFPVQLFSLY